MAIINANEIEEIAEFAKNLGKRVSMTNGCFDLLHVGHIESIEMAALCGEVLIVAVNSDKSVRQAKGDSRPIVPEHERVKMIDSLKGVDYVVMFDNEEELHELYKTISPSVLVKGEEYRGKEIFGSEYAGHVVFVPTRHDRSTTGLIERIKNA